MIIICEIHIYYTSILKVSGEFVEKCRRSRLFGDGYLGKIGFRDMAISVFFWRFLGAQMANFTPINF